MNKVKNLRQDYSDQEKKLTDKVNDLITKKERELESKIDTIRSWEKYINLNIGDPVYFETNLTLGGEKGIHFIAYVEAEIVDIAKTKAKIKVINATFNDSSSKIIKQNVISYLDSNQCWVEFKKLEKRLTIQDRRDMQLEKILK